MVTKLQTRKTTSQTISRSDMQKFFLNSSIPKDELMVNLPLYIRSSALAKILYINELYEMITKTPGVIMEFGVWWGANIALFENLRAVYEPYNYTRKIIGFDTFEGYSKPTKEDGDDNLVFTGNYGVENGYEKHLKEILDTHQNENVMGHIDKIELHKGDAAQSLENYLEKNPETIVSLAYFDMQLYTPTKRCLELLKPRLTKGSVIALDELICPEFPGETQAFQEVFGSRNVRLQRSKYLPDRTYFIIE